MPPKKKETADVKTPTSFDDVKNFKLDELKEAAKKAGIKNLPKTKALILDVFRVHFGGEAEKAKEVQAPSPKSYEEIEKFTVVKLRAVADKLGLAYKKTAKKAELLSLLKEAMKSKEKASTPPPQAPVVGGQKAAPVIDMEKIKNYTVVRLKALADELGLSYKKTIKKADLLDLISSSRKGGEKKKSPVVVEATEEDLEVEAWPVPEEILRKKYNTVAKLKDLLAKMGITKALPKNKNEILAFFRKKRCSPTNYSCSDKELCDLRNQLCEELGLIVDASGKPKKLEGGMDVVFAEGTFYGPKHIIEKIRADWEKSKVGIVKEPEAAPSKTPSPVLPSGGVEERKQTQAPPAQVVVQQVVVSEPKEKGISPININQLLDKTQSESDIRKTILHCLGLYQDIDPNDEILP